MDDMKIFAENLKYYMYCKHVSVKELSKACAVSDTTVCKWRAGTAAPRMNRIEQICQTLHVTRYDLLYEEAFKTNTETPEDGMTILIEKYQRLNNEDQKFITQTMELLFLKEQQEKRDSN